MNIDFLRSLHRLSRLMLHRPMVGRLILAQEMRVRFQPQQPIDASVVPILPLSSSAMGTSIFGNVIFAARRGPRRAGKAERGRPND